MIDLIEIYVHWYAGRSQAQIADSLGLDRKTVRKYLAPVAASGLVAGGPPVMTEADWRDRAQEWFPALVDTGLRQVTWPAIGVHRDYISAQLAAGVTVSTIHQRLVDEHGLVASVASVRRWVGGNLPEEARRAAVRVLRPGPVEPGSEAQIDYGRLGVWTDPATGRRHTVQAFVMVLACSRHMFVRPVLRMDQEAWTRCHVEAFAFFNGVPARLVPDNLKTGVDKPDLYDPRINRSYAELAAHYGTLVDPARAFKPKDKPRVERPMPYVRDSFWRGRAFTALDEMQSGAVRWCREVAGARSSRALDGAAPAVVFAAVEAPALGPLPTTPFVLATWSTGKVGPDIHVKVGPALYSVPWRLLGQQVHARSTATMVQVVHEGAVVATHVRRERGRATNVEHYPPEKNAFHMRTPTWCRQVAEQVGPACTDVVATLLEVNALFRLRAAQGVLGLRDKHTPARLEAACAKAIAVGDPSYRTIKGILIAGTETTTAAGATGAAGDVPAFLHGPKTLFETIRVDGDLAPVLELPTTSGDTGEANRAAHA
jgi:transposase